MSLESSLKKGVNEPVHGEPNTEELIGFGDDTTLETLKRLALRKQLQSNLSSFKVDSDVSNMSDGEQSNLSSVDDCTDLAILV